MTKAIIQGIIVSVAAVLIIDRIKAIRKGNSDEIAAQFDGLGASETQSETWV